MFLNIVFFSFVTSLFVGFFGRFFGNIGSSFIAWLGLFINFLFSIFCFFYSFAYKIFFFTNLGYWMAFGPFEVFWSFSFDPTALIMFLVVNSVSFVVHSFSFGYMRHDPHLARFMSYISLFTFFMLILVTADNFIQLFLGWEGVGLCSYLLIGFWYTRVNAIASALKALIVNRISDFAVIVGLVLVFFVVFSYDIYVLFSLSSFFYLTKFFFLKKIFISNVLTLICFFFLIGAMGKSAQIFLHTWLPDAMEGPTPVSALIHAATMVTAGIFLIIKASPVFEFTGSFLTFLIIIGGLTAFMSGTIGMVQYDIKKVIAYSTCSQLGYMLLACGFSNYFVSFFHLMNHAFFKALLFLCAGCVIHSVNNEQDMRRFGGLVKLLPVIFGYFFLGSLALAGFTFLTGFFSKDFILEQLAFYFYSNKFGVSWSFAAFFLLLTTALTGYYSMRLFLFTFLDIPSFFKKSFSFLHESDFFLITPLVVLVIGSIFSGYWFKDFFLGMGADALSFSVFVYPSYFFLMETELLSLGVKMFFFFFFIVIALGVLPFIYIILQRLFFNRGKAVLNFFYTKLGFEIFFFFNFKWGFDALYNRFINKNLLRLFYFHLYELFDKMFLERFLGHVSILKSSFFVFRSLRFFFQSASLSYYLFFFLVVFIFLFIF